MILNTKKKTYPRKILSSPTKNIYPKQINKSMLPETSLRNSHISKKSQANKGQHVKSQWDET